MNFSPEGLKQEISQAQDHLADIRFELQRESADNLGALYEDRNKVLADLDLLDQIARYQKEQGTDRLESILSSVQQNSDYLRENRSR
jgi:hypothetical protein